MPNHTKIVAILLLLLSGCYAKQTPSVTKTHDLATSSVATIESYDSYWEDTSLTNASLRIKEEQNPQPTAKVPSASEIGKSWLYGQGIGTSMLNIGTTIAFPPYAVYLLGNAGLEVAGLPTLYASDALPETPKSYVMDFYNGFTSVPGRLAALISGEDFREKRYSPKDARSIVEQYANNKP